MKSRNFIFRIIMLLCISMGVAGTTNVMAQEMKRYPGKSDVYYSSGNRLPPVNREDLDDFGKEIYDNIVQGGRSFTYDEENKEYMGPRAIRMNSPTVGFHLSSSNSYIRYESGIDPKLRELIILNAAWEINNEYEWNAHENTAQEVGLSQEIIDIIKYDKSIPGNLGESETTLMKLCRELLRGTHELSSDTYATALELFGAKRLVEIVALLGGYTATGMMLHAFDQQLPPGEKSLLPDRFN